MRTKRLLLGPVPNEAARTLAMIEPLRRAASLRLSARAKKNSRSEILFREEERLGSSSIDYIPNERPHAIPATPRHGPLNCMKSDAISQISAVEPNGNGRISPGSFLLLEQPRDLPQTGCGRAGLNIRVRFSWSEA